MIDASRSRLQRPRTIALALLACALALRLLIPAGWMPVADAQGLHLVLCSGSGPMEMPSAHAMAGMKGMDHHGHHDPSMPDHPCAFAGLGLALAEPLLPQLALPARVAAVRVDHAGETVAIGRGLAAPPPPATGPPALG
ncbi:MAG: hypothetical protein ACTHOJ_11770 [Sphingomonas oligoaromativorans]|jgi:hypothetical protein|uniref:hypothetical protein n=1 Tax=Sphingomonas oligoaromativorans TaxID=575322 RepID=UPI00142490D9|nr:hypothetical protein [Sphingomonas oligoaromativorans]NIJ34653.1 hypothetical protein [Sphingomonas oligoaromativorans]